MEHRELSPRNKYYFILLFVCHLFYSCDKINDKQVVKTENNSETFKTVDDDSLSIDSVLAYSVPEDSLVTYSQLYKIAYRYSKYDWNKLKSNSCIYSNILFKHSGFYTRIEGDDKKSTLFVDRELAYLKMAPVINPNSTNPSSLYFINIGKTYLLYFVNIGESKPNGFYVFNKKNGLTYFINCHHYIDYSLLFSDSKNIASITIVDKKFKARSILHFYSSFLNYKERSFSDSLKFSVYSLNKGILELDNKNIKDQLSEGITFREIEKMFTYLGVEISSKKYNSNREILTYLW